MIGKNNPLNIRYSKKNNWKGQIGQTRGFCDFSDIEYGIRACLYLLKKSYRKRGLLTFGELIKAYAPPSENNTQRYISYVCDKLDVYSFDKPIISTEWIKMVHYMSIFEGNEVSIKDIYKCYIKYFKD